MPKSTLSQHFKVLRESGLIRAERKGVEMHNTSRSPRSMDASPGSSPRSSTHTPNKTGTYKSREAEIRMSVVPQEQV
ncbi:ArsR/SmtB family transcription factor, partial [Edaphobacter sp. HDX4]|uniref:ArsR/SmtB family transcription factor n=1 Tax=Edaphobacter sp. HDX4 TaxID=2794064 RepID=UPI002FE5968A